MAKGIIKRYDFRKGFGFIADDKSGEDFFFHKSNWQGDGPIRQGIAVKFVDKDSDKGPQAESVIPLDHSSSKPSSKIKSVAKPASLEDRVASLENSLATWKILNFLALAAVIALAVERFVL
ncbi:MAG: cold shock CspA family protein [Cellvibrionaceae bacterium]|jgi:cold shock CspA family protein